MKNERANTPKSPGTATDPRTTALAGDAGLSRRQALFGIAAGSATVALGGGVIGCAEAPTAEEAIEETAPAMVEPEVITFDLSVAAPGATSVHPYELPSLPFAPDAIEAVVDARTMEIHHGRHHQGYTNKLNAALENNTDLQGRTIFELLGDLESLPESVRTAVRNNGGGYLNHAMFWPLLAPGGTSMPEGDLADAIDASFGSLDAFREEFGGRAKSLFGSGWAWLVADGDGNLSIRQYANQNTPLEDGLKPVLGIDVWEHAYYLKYQNRRGDYVDNVLDAVNWTQAAQNFGA